MQTDDLTRLETERLILRPFREADYPLILKISSDPGTVKYLYYWGRDGITPEADARRFLSYAMKNWEKQPIRAREYCLVRKSDGAAIGDGSLEWVAGQEGVAEIGWILAKDYRGQGYVTEMGKALLRAGFQVLCAHTIIAHCDQRNAASSRVMERLGMRLAGVEPGARPAKTPEEAPGDECTYAITRAEWDVQRGMEVL